MLEKQLTIGIYSSVDIYEAGETISIEKLDEWDMK